MDGDGGRGGSAVLSIRRMARPEGIDLERVSDRDMRARDDFEPQCDSLL